MILSKNPSSSLPPKLEKACRQIISHPHFKHSIRARQLIAKKNFVIHHFDYSINPADCNLPGEAEKGTHVSTLAEGITLHRISRMLLSSPEILLYLRLEKS